jgi:hypothetical protein
MSPLQALKELLDSKFISEDGSRFQARAHKGLSITEIDTLAQHLPSQRLPDEIVDLLRFAAGFDCEFFDSISFTNVDGFALEHFFPNIVELGGDGLGNYWLLDIDYQGNWGPVYYTCHDPAVIMKQAEDLTEFIQQIHGYLQSNEQSLFAQLYEHKTYAVWKQPDGGFINIEKAKTAGDNILKEFASQLPTDYLIADLRNKPVGTGFAWGRYYSIMDKEVRCKDLPLWAIQPKRKGFFARLFGR